VDELRNYREWHKEYDDPDSGISWRLRAVQSCIADVLDTTTGPVRVLSSCSGDGRDIIGVLRPREDAHRVHVTLVEIDPELADRATSAAREAELDLEVRVTDAGNTDAYVGVVPADLVLLVGIFGNIDDEDLERTIKTSPELCAPGATLVWSRGRDHTDRNDAVRRWFAEAGFTEIDYLERNTGSRPALGAVRYDGAPRELRPGRKLFTFWR
jgi:hypothetical protein